jgi:hypothetical protein
MDFLKAAKILAAGDAMVIATPHVGNAVAKVLLLDYLSRCRRQQRTTAFSS